MEYEFRDLKQIIDDIAAPHASPNGVGHERGKAELIAKISKEICFSLEKLNSSVEASVVSNNKLSRKIFWLNIVLAIATTVGAIATVVIAYKS